MLSTPARANGPVTTRNAKFATDGRLFFVLLGCLWGVGPVAMDMYIPGLPDVARDLGTSTSATQLTIAVYLIGMAAGQIVFGQLCDVSA